MAKARSRKFKRGAGAVAPGTVLPFFSRGVAFEAYSTLLQMGHDVEDEPFDIVYCKRSHMQHWISETVLSHYARSEEARLAMHGTPPQSFSVAVESDLSSDPLVSIVLDIQATTKPLSRVMGSLRVIARHSNSTEFTENLRENFGDCWLCLDNLYECTPESGSLVCSDVFCCGHPVCVACSRQAGRLDRCGVCRQRCPVDNKIKERIMKVSVQDQLADGGCPSPDDTLAEVAAIMESLGL
jgi:hypothetical protein